jgi:hypothetical protein
MRVAQQFAADGRLEKHAAEIGPVIGVPAPGPMQAVAVPPGRKVKP